ncbi:hypothetical protein ACTXT7_003144 [Hymenolepis weldensis]
MIPNARTARVCAFMLVRLRDGGDHGDTWDIFGQPLSVAMKLIHYGGRSGKK